MLEARAGVKFATRSLPVGDLCIELYGSRPVWTDLNGPQPEKDWEFGVSAGIAF